MLAGDEHLPVVLLEVLAVEGDILHQQAELGLAEVLHARAVHQLAVEVAAVGQPDDHRAARREVVLHDLRDPKHAIRAIENNLSGRRVGDSATELGLARIADPRYPSVLQNYPNRFPDGRPAKSTSIGIKNAAGETLDAFTALYAPDLQASLARRYDEGTSAQSVNGYETIKPLAD